MAKQSGAKRVAEWKRRQLADPVRAQKYREQRAKLARERAKRKRDELDQLRADMSNREEIIKWLRGEMSRLVQESDKLRQHAQLTSRRELVLRGRLEQYGEVYDFGEFSGSPITHWERLAGMTDVELRAWAEQGLERARNSE